MSARKRIKVGEVVEFESFDEAVAALLANSEPGQTIVLHHEDCEIDPNRGESSCTCEPMELRGGAQA